MKRVSTGIVGLDEMLNGGLISGRSYVVKGGPGSGKTTLGVQFALNGVENGETVLYLTLEEPKDSLILNMKSFGWDLERYDTFIIFDLSPIGDEGWNFYHDTLLATGEVNVRIFLESLRNYINKVNPTRIVIDPLTILKLFYTDEINLRKDIVALVKHLSEEKITAILLSEYSPTFQPEDYIVSGVIELREFEKGSTVLRGIRIRKLRGTKFDENIRPYKITEKGIIVYNKERLML
ncbi:MAG: RAD55 family ATPase [Candidatus Asgardarchaeia archaeon]